MQTFFPAFESGRPIVKSYRKYVRLLDIFFMWVAIIKLRFNLKKF